MIKSNLIDERILHIMYSGVVTQNDINSLIQANLQVGLKLMASGKPWAVLTDLRECEDISTDGRVAFKAMFDQYNAIKTSVHIVIFKDRHHPVIKWIQETTIKSQLLFGNYFTDFDKALAFVREKMKEMEKELAD